MKPIIYIDRLTGKKCHELVYGEKALDLLYGDSLLTSTIGSPLAHLLSRFPFFSAFCGWLKKRPGSAKQILPFIKAYGLDTSEFLEDSNSFSSFNDFFIRKLKLSARPIDENKNTAVIPADGRYWFYQQFDLAEGIVVKGEKFDLTSLLNDADLAAQYAKGSMAIARLCPTDYHRFHFPCSCNPDSTKILNGWLYSVNPLAIKKNIHIFTQNKRSLCKLHTDRFGEVLFIEVGATCVGAIHQTYTPHQHYPKGTEKGFFSFGASSLIIIFPPNAIEFDRDLIEASRKGFEIKCLIGQSMGRLNEGKYP